MCDMECKCNADERHESIKEKLQALPTEELLNVAVKLNMENQELQARCEYQERELKNMASDRERAYLNGKIDGLMFSIRCNGVSGAETRL